MNQRKRTSWFLDPTLIRAVKVVAAESDRDQSEVVQEAIDEYLDRHNHRCRRSRVRPEPVPTG